jgi:hypothetical protein
MLTSGIVEDFNSKGGKEGNIDMKSWKVEKSK